MDRSPSASTGSAGGSRPSTASTNSGNVYMQARVRLHEADEEAAASKPDEAVSSTTDLDAKNPYKLEGQCPVVDTKLEDVDLPDHVLSRSGTPSQWAFDAKDASLKTSPPSRPTSATLCSPPVPRKVPISVDHHLRK